MKTTRTLVMGGIVVLLGGVAFATPPGMGQHFDCGDGGDTSCAADDGGCVPNTKDHLNCSKKIDQALAKAVVAAGSCHMKQVESRFKGASENGAGTSEENCEDNPGNSAQGKLDKILAKMQTSGKCDPSQITPRNRRRRSCSATARRRWTPSTRSTTATRRAPR